MVSRTHAILVLPTTDAECIRYGGIVGQGHKFFYILMLVVCSVAVVCSGPVVCSGTVLYSGGVKDTHNSPVFFLNSNATCVLRAGCVLWAGFVLWWCQGHT